VTDLNASFSLSKEEFEEKGGDLRFFPGCECHFQEDYVSIIMHARRVKNGRTTIVPK
jgi:hypothetical protein